MTQLMECTAASLEQAEVTLVALHGRGGDAADALSLAQAVARGRPAALVAPQAPGYSWYPQSFLAPTERNQPFLGRALQQVAATVDDLLARGVDSSRLVLLGFSQGACLATEFLLRHPRRYGAVIAFTGGLIGDRLTDPRPLPELGGTPVLLTGGDPDPHVPWTRVEESADLLRRCGAQVQLQRFPGLPHTVSPAQLQLAQSLISHI